MTIRKTNNFSINFLHLQATLICCLMLGFVNLSNATEPSTLLSSSSPEEVVHSVINMVASDMRSNENIYKNDAQKLQDMVAEKVETYFNFPRMAKLAMARHWLSANEEQRAAITREYQISFTRSYANTLFAYRNVSPKIQLQPGATATKASIKMNVKSEDGDSTTLFLRLEKTKDQWQIIDVSAEGVSLVITARGQFSDKITKDGIDGLIQSLTEENRKKSL